MILIGGFVMQWPADPTPLYALPYNVSASNVGALTLSNTKGSSPMRYWVRTRKGYEPILIRCHVRHNVPLKENIMKSLCKQSIHKTSKIA